MRHQCPTGRRKRQTRWPSDAGTDETCDDSWDRCERPQGREFQLPATERNGTERNGTERNGTERNGTERNGTDRLLE
ncbi:hypothetical protein IPC1370_17990 [Pseudomonas aeruginosa]|nr:hypothetical protein IPC1370_17990 [Pseudomonas aeruginosa]